MVNLLVLKGWALKDQAARGVTDLEITPVGNDYLERRTQETLLGASTKNTTKAQSPTTVKEEQDPLAIFISHSSKDKDIAELLIHLLKDALSLNVEDIRCSSVPGYTFEAGVSIEESVKREAFGAEAFVGLLTPNSLRSTWVLFELGARWGADKRIVPVLAKGSSVSDLDGPLPGSVLLNSSNEDELYQLVRDLASTAR